MAVDIGAVFQAVSAMANAISALPPILDRLARKDKIQRADLEEVTKLAEEARQGVDEQRFLGQFLLKYLQYYADSMQLPKYCDKLSEVLIERRTRLENSSDQFWQDEWRAIDGVLGDIADSSRVVTLMEEGRFAFLSDDHKRTLEEKAKRLRERLSSVAGQIRVRDTDIASLWQNVAALKNEARAIQTAIDEDVSQLVNYIAFGRGVY